METTQTIHTITAAIAVARGELATIRKQLTALQALQAQADQLRAFISEGEGVLVTYGVSLTNCGDPATLDTAPPACLDAAAGDVRCSMAAYAKRALEHFGQPTRIKDMHAYLQSLGMLQEATDAKKLADALRHQAIFQQISRGVYAMRSWPKEQKRLPQEETH